MGEIHFSLLSPDLLFPMYFSCIYLLKKIFRLVGSSQFEKDFVESTCDKFLSFFSDFFGFIHDKCNRHGSRAVES